MNSKFKSKKKPHLFIVSVRCRDGQRTQPNTVGNILITFYFHRTGKDFRQSE